MISKKAFYYGLQLYLVCLVISSLVSIITYENQMENHIGILVILCIWQAVHLIYIIGKIFKNEYSEELFAITLIFGFGLMVGGFITLNFDHFGRSNVDTLMSILFIIHFCTVLLGGALAGSYHYKEKISNRDELVRII